GAVKTGAKFCSRVRKESVISMGRLPCVGVLRPRQVAKKSRGSRPVFLLSHSPSKVRNKNSARGVLFRGSLPVLEHLAELFNGLATQDPDRTGFAPIFQRPEDSRQPLQ